ncbi:hypothetical protein [Pelagibius sp.]|uniref:hypothetical protein n=1 Tax=Pelagibius sp. TaxID=1931238 RepID=UPI003BB1539B
MTAIQIVFSYLPLLVIAASAVVLFRRSGHSPVAQGLSALPFVIAIFSLIASLAGERAPADGIQGLWAAGAVLAVLALKRWPGSGTSE